MNRSRKIFLFFVVLFAAFLLFTVVDISRRTTFPGARKGENKVPMAEKDTVKGDSSAKTATHPR